MKQNLFRKIPQVMHKGVKYHVIQTNISMCMSCHAECDRELCLSLPDCTSPYHCIYVKKPTKEKYGFELGEVKYEIPAVR